MTRISVSLVCASALALTACTHTPVVTTSASWGVRGARVAR